MPPQQPPHPEPELQPPPLEAREALVTTDQVLHEGPNDPPDVQVREVPNAPTAAPAEAGERELQYDDDDDEAEFQDVLKRQVHVVRQAPSEGHRMRAPAPAVAAAAASSLDESSRAPPPASFPLQRSTVAAPRGLQNVPFTMYAQLKSRGSTLLKRHYIELT